MTVQVQNSVQYFAGPIAAGTILFITEFTFIDNSHVSIKLRNDAEIWRYGVDYLVEGANELTRKVTILREVPSDKVLAVYLDIPITQLISPEEGGKFPAKIQEFTLDKLTYICKMLQDKLARALQISIDTEFDGTLPELVANRTFKINEDTSGIVLSKYDPDNAIAITEGFKLEAQTSAQAAAQSEINAKISETNAKQSETNAKASETATAQLKNETNQIKQDTQNIADKALQDIDTAKTDAVNKIATDKAGATSAISLSKTDALSSISTAKTSAIEEINTTKTTAIASVNSTKDSANASVNATKNQVIQDVQTEGTKQKAQLQPYVDLAKDWAIKTDGTVDGTEYSAKYYAEKSKLHSAVTYKQLMASSGYTRGEVNDDKEGYKNVSSYAYSTFDLSKFTVVGSPTITDDGILTASSLNYVTFKNVNLTTASSWRIKGKFTYNEDLSSVQVIFTQLGAYGIQIYFASSNKMTFQGSLNGSSWKFHHVTSNIFINGQTYHYIIEFTGIQYNLWISTDNISYEIWASYTSSEKISALNNTIVYAIGSSGIANRDFKGSIDLKSIAIWADGVPVFNGNITGADIYNINEEETQIPYTLSKTGSKIVDVAYRDRVQDLYTQTGEALYYTIDEQNQNFTLPMGEVYGMITNLQDNSANTSLTNLTNGLANVLCTTAPIDVEKDYGVSIIGSLTNNNNVLSGFSTSNYAQINTNFAPESNTWEMNFLVTTGDNVTSTQTVCATSSESIEMGLQSSKFNLRINSRSIYNGTYTVLTNTTYYIKVQFTGSQYILSYSLNGSSYNQDITISLATVINSDTTIYIGKDINNNVEPWLGSINLTGCNILVNNSQIWQGIVPTASSTASSQNPAVVIENYLNGTSGYRVWSDGYCEQWGYLSPVNQNISYGISLLKSYKDNNYNVSACAVYEGYYTATAWIYSKTMNSFQLAGQRWANSGYTGIVTGVMWKTEGYIS